MNESRGEGGAKNSLLVRGNREDRENTIVNSQAGLQN